jgi:hypothetical protein
MSSVLYTLALLACPIGMGLMMFMMMRGQNNSSTDRAADSGADRGEVDALRAEIEALKAERAADTPRHPQP